MANDNSTARPDPIPVKAEYFECPEGAPSVLCLLMALDGVCSALDAETANFSLQDDEQVNRISGLSTASAILAAQFYGRYYASNKPPSQRTLAKRRKQKAERDAADAAMREKLAGPAWEYLRAANAIQQTEGTA